MSKKIIYLALALSLVLAACSGGGGDATAPDGTTTSDGTTSGGTTTTTIDGSTITPVTTTCTPAPALPSQSSRVFKGCDSAGVAQYYDLTECVKDNTTGLIWQGQTAAGTGLRANDQYKTNYDSTTALQKYNGTAYVAPTQADIDSSTNSIGFKNAINATNLCGSGAWRLPTKVELLGIVKTSESPTIDNAWFPNSRNWYYWTSSPYAGAAARAWDVNFDNGNDGSDDRGDIHGDDAVVRLVH